jgi:hypothetical protein
LAARAQQISSAGQHCREQETRNNPVHYEIASGLGARAVTASS